MLLAGGVTAISTLAGCGNKPAPKIGYVAPARTPDQTYVVRAIITQMPDPEKKGTELRAQHEAIDDFRDNTGKIVGMGAMDMEFPPHELLDLSTFKVGDKVSITFSVWWGNSPGWLAMKMTKLPAETELVFRRANPPKEDPLSKPATPAATPAPASITNPAPAPTPAPAPAPAPAPKP
jgi:Cu/Ag efflux protein CusF